MLLIEYVLYVGQFRSKTSVCDEVGNTTHKDKILQDIGTDAEGNPTATVRVTAK